MAEVKKICLSCHHYRLVKTALGLCRVDRKEKNYPEKLPEETCPQWRDSGQQYFIRLGWIKARENSAEQQNVR